MEIWYEVVRVDSSGVRSKWPKNYKRRGYAMRIGREFIPPWPKVEIWECDALTAVRVVTLYKDMQ